MIVDSINIKDLGETTEEAFVTFEERLRAAFTKARFNDREENTDGDGYYRGNYEPERHYVSSILAFLDEYELNLDVPDISDSEKDHFAQHFSIFSNKINRVRTQFALRKHRLQIGVAGSPIVIAAPFKEEITTYLSTIKKIVMAELKDGNKRDAILKKLAALQLEIDRDRTTVDAVFGRLLDFCKVAGEGGKEIEPMMKHIDRVKELLWGNSERVKLITHKERPRLIEDKVTAKQISKDAPFDDEIPF